MLGSTNYSESYSYSDGDEGDGSLTQMTTGTGKTLNYTYDAAKRLQNVKVKDGGTTLFTTAYAYRAISDNRSSAQVEFRNVRVGGDTGRILEGAKYTYDALGNITMISQSTGDYYPLVKYTYDSQNQLTSEVYYNGHGSTISNITKAYYYTYDTAGNLRKVEEGTVVDGAIVKTDKQTYAYGNSIWVDLLTKVNNLPIAYEGQTVSYNAGSYTVSGTPTSGNPILYNNGVRALDLSWTNGRQLSYVSCYDEHWQVAYSYDADGIRTQKNDDGVLHKYITQNGKVVRETIGSGNTAKVLDFIYDESGRPFALIYTNGTNAPVTYYYILNLQGDVVKLVNENGVEKAKYAYDAWGNILPNSISGEMADINPLRYRGYYYDAESGWYYLQSRYYDPVIHRFINADSYASTGQGTLGCNMFAYCNNNSVNLTDTDGGRPYWEHNYGDITAYTDSGSSHARSSGTYNESGETDDGCNASDEAQVNRAKTYSGSGSCNGVTFSYYGIILDNTNNANSIIHAQVYSPERANLSKCFSDYNGFTVVIYDTKVRADKQVNDAYLQFQNGQVMHLSFSFNVTNSFAISDELEGLIRTCFDYCGGGFNPGGIMWAGDGIWITQQR